jgi:hypothetical protein
MTIPRSFGRLVRFSSTRCALLQPTLCATLHSGVYDIVAPTILRQQARCRHHSGCCSSPYPIP